MSDCCTSILDLGCVGHCDVITVTGVTATVTGTFTIAKVPGGGVYTQAYTLGETITFTNIFNEDSVVIFEVLDPDGNAITDGTNDCFQVEVKTTIDLVSSAVVLEYGSSELIT